MASDESESSGGERGMPLLVIVASVALAAILIYLMATGGITTNTTPITDNVDVEQPVSGNGTAFTLRSGRSSWSYPATVEFQQLSGSNGGNWTVTTAYEGDPFVVDLNESARYRIHVTSASGEEKVLGSFTPEHSDDHIELVIDPCCHDDFSAQNRSVTSGKINLSGLPVSSR